MKISVNEVIRICNGKLLCGDGDTVLKNLIIDTRELECGDTFVGIKGENYNGNDFLYDAVEKGANCVILDENKDITDIMVNICIIIFLLFIFLNLFKINTSYKYTYHVRIFAV